MMQPRYISRGLSLRGMLLLLTTATMWGMGPIFIKRFGDYYNVWTQNAFRYSCAAIILLTWMTLARKPLGNLSRAQWLKLALVTVTNVLMQTCYAAAYYFIYPSVGSLVTRINIVFVILLSFLIFHDERQVIRSPRFILGAMLALGGVSLVIVGQDARLLANLHVTRIDFWLGISLVVGFAFFGSLYALSIKHAVRDIPPFVSFTHVSWMTALGLCLPMWIMGGMPDLWRQPLLPLGLMVLTAFLFIVVAHVCYYAALRDIKAVVSTSVMQLTPVITCVLSALVYGDRLTILQFAGGAMAIGGATLAALAQTRVEEAV